MSAVLKVLNDKKEILEGAVEVIQQGVEALANDVGSISPIFQIAGPLLKLALDNVENGEERYIKDQLQTLQTKLDVISDKIDAISRELEKSQMNITCFEMEKVIRNQYRKFSDIIQAKPQYKETKKEFFLEYFEDTDGDKSLHDIYDAIMGNSVSGKSILQTALTTEQYDRRVLEEFIARVKRLFCMGVFVVVGNAVLIGKPKEDELVETWENNFNAMEKKMKAAIDECIDAFPDLAKAGIEKLITEQSCKDNPELAKQIHTFLKDKFYWLSWSIRVYDNQSSGYLTSLLRKDDYHHIMGKNYFQFLKYNTNVIVSYSSNPKPVDKFKIRQLMESQDRKQSATSIGNHVRDNMPGYLVHSIGRYKGLWGEWNFPDGCHYWENYRNITLIVHSE
ncbi:protein rapunzel-like [Protopterus annectens]|uniref:protein rapunzel-like n=1 Tax=Protopterus annectens TaxID=7888 RepID=UPI001CFA1810|nr:protein rapunzel-like [Protopterus annectens]